MYEKTPSSLPDPPGGRWMATEKVHGAHLAIYHERDGVRAYTRRSALPPERMASWFGLHRRWPGLAARVQALPVGTRAYGELAGGHYLGMTDDEDAAVQTGIWYAPEPVWLGFALADETGWYAPSQARERLASVGLRTVPLVAVGSLPSLSAISLDFESLVPAMLGLPPIDGNRAEGLVLVHDRSGPVRPATIKRKHPDFSEGPDRLPPRPSGDDEHEAWLTGLVVRMLTEARVASARGKVGPEGDLAGELVADVLADLCDLAGELVADVLADLCDAVGALTDAERRIVTEAVLRSQRARPRRD